MEELREWILDHKTTDADIKRVARGLTSEIIAAVTKLMSNLDLIYGAKNPCNRTCEYNNRSSWNFLR